MNSIVGSVVGSSEDSSLSLAECFSVLAYALKGESDLFIITNKT